MDHDIFSCGRRPCRNIFDWLDEVRLRPLMFVRDGSLRDLESQVRGYRTALSQHGIDEGVPQLGRHFSTWLRRRTGWSQSAGWAYAIEVNCPADSTPLEQFFVLADAYRRLTPVAIARVDLAPRHRPTGTRYKVGFETLMPPPVRIEVIEYQPDDLVFLRHFYPDHYVDDDIVVVRGTLQLGALEDAKRWVADEFQVEDSLWQVVPSR